jgi:lipopolysaccharide export system protein LptA
VRITIERIRTLVLAAGVLLIVVLAAFLAIGKWKSPFNRQDIPKRLGIDIQQEANGVTYTQAHGGHTIFKIHASRVVQLRNDQATLHDVKIELYGQNGNSVDRIQGDEFQYDQKNGIATAAGPVEITLMRPQPPPGSKQKTKTSNADSEIHVRTSGLVFNQQTGIASTSQRVDFSSAQGSGSAMGATYQSDQGLLILDRAVELTTRQGANPVQLHAQHAEIDRDTELARLEGATAQTPSEHASAAQALIAYRDDGSIERLDASGGLTISTTAGSHLAAPRGTMQFDEDNRPRSGRFEGGVIMDSSTAGRQMSGSSPTMTLAFTADGELRHAHLEGAPNNNAANNDVEMRSQQQGQSTVNGHSIPVQMDRTWHSSVADVDFREVRKGQVEPAQVHGVGNVILTGETRRGNEPSVPSRLAADAVTGLFGPNSTLISMTGIGHASIEETTATGARQMATGDQVQARFAPAGPAADAAKSSPSISASGPASGPAESAQIESADLQGHVTLFQQPAIKAGAKPQPPLHATAGRAVYEAAGQWLHLTLNPRIEDGGMQLTAGKVDVSQQSGDAFAHGDVKATWINMGAMESDSNAAPVASTVGLGGKGPVHAIAAEAQLHQSTGEATFRGHARLWQQDNSIAAPLIVIDRQKQTLVAKTSTASEPVVAVLLNAGATPANPAAHPNPHAATSVATPSVVRVRGGDLWYSDAERKAIMRSAPLSAVTAQSDGIESTSAQVDLILAAPGAARQAAGGASAQVETMRAIGHVVLTSQERRGTGEKLVYTSADDDYVLTGTASAPPRLTDPQRGNVTGAALIFNSRDDSVSIEGGGHQTTTETTAPK